MEHFAFIVLSLMILLLMVLIHELGHYSTAKILGFVVEEFSIGFGPKIFSKRRKNGELVSLRVLPLGGYCSFWGEELDDSVPNDDAAPNKEDSQPLSNNDSNATVKSADCTAPTGANIQTNSTVAAAAVSAEHNEIPIASGGKAAARIPFYAQKPWKRIIVLLGGVAFNFISAIIFSLIYIWAVGYAVPQVGKVYADASGEIYCPDLLPGDIIIAVDDREISVLNTFNDLTEGIRLGDTAVLRVNRNGEIINVNVQAKQITTTNAADEKIEYVGFGFSSDTEFIGGTAKNAFTYCVPYTFKLSWSIIGAFFDLLTGQASITSMTGPVGSINFMAQISLADPRNILILLPLLASNLAIFNILPFPALDGSHIVFTAIEWIRGKPIKRKVESMIHFVGLMLLFGFVLIVDILSFVL